MEPALTFQVTVWPGEWLSHDLEGAWASSSSFFFFCSHILLFYFILFIFFEPRLLHGS
jgi:hypothetical protein